MSADKQSVQIGDAIKFSAILLQQIHERPKHESVVVKLVEIRINEDGTKLLVLEGQWD